MKPMADNKIISIDEADVWPGLLNCELMLRSAEYMKYVVIEQIREMLHYVMNNCPTKMVISTLSYALQATKARDAIIEIENPPRYPIYDNDGYSFFLGYAREEAVKSDRVEIVKFLLDHKVRYYGGGSDREMDWAFGSKSESVALYLLEQGRCRLEYYGPGRSLLHCAVIEQMPKLVDAVAKKYPYMLWIRLEIGEKFTPMELAVEKLNLEIVRILKYHMGYVDFFDYTTFYRGRYSTFLHNVIRELNNSNSELVQKCVKFLVTQGIDVDDVEWMDYKTARELLIEKKPWFLETYDEAVREGREIWEWNQGVMREVVKWSGCVVMGYGGSSGGDVAGDVKRTNSTGIGGIVGIGKRAVEAVVKFAPAQFEEKLEMGTVQLLCAQAMLEMGHGIVFGNMHHGGYVKYVGTTSKGVTLHGWNATVTCDYHIEVKMTGWCEMHGQHSVGYDGGHSGDPTHGGKMPYGMQYSAHVTHMHMTRIVMADGDSYVDHKVTVMTDMWELASHMSVLLCTEMENGWVYNDKLCLQKNGAGQYALENEHAQGDGTMHVWGQGHDVNHGAVVVMGMHKLASHMYDKQGVVSYLRVWGGDAYDQKLYAQQQWYAETGEVLPTLAVMTQSHHDMITALDNPCQLQHSAHAHDEAAQQYIPQVVPQLMHTSPQHHLQLHIPHDELQQDANVHHIVNFLHSISML